MLTYILFVIGFVILILGANWLVEGASSVAKRFRVPDLVIGLTIVAFGTSAPELAVNLFASAQNSAGIAIGNVLGSNVFNILLIIGFAAVISPLRVHNSTVWKEIPFSLLAAIVLAIIANDRLLNQAESSVLSRSDGLILLCFFAIFMYYTFEAARKGRIPVEEGFLAKPVWKSTGMIIAGLLGLVLGGRWIVDGAVQIAEVAGMSESVIGLTIVAAGTSLPELATSAVAAFKRKADIAIGNVVGSNIFNIFFVLGVSATVKELPFPKSSNVDIGMVVLSSILLYFLIFVGKRNLIGRKEGIGFLVLFTIYIAYLLTYHG